MIGVVTTDQILRLYPHADEALRERVRRAVDLVNEAAAPNALQAHFDLGADFTIGGFVPAGKDIRRHLAGATSVVVGVCTLGAGIDRLIETLQMSDLSLAYVVDVAAGWGVENLAEKACQALAARLDTEGLTCTTRYSCGYGDFDIAGQKDLLRISGADKAFRIHVNEGSMMYPTKSITYLVGIKPKQ